MITRVTDPTRRTFGKQLAEHGVVVERVALSRMELDQARLLVLVAAIQIDAVRAKGALREIGQAKAVVPLMALKIVDRAMQFFGAEGLCQDTVLPGMWSQLRTLRYADGPDEVHIQQIGKKYVRSPSAVIESGLINAIASSSVHRNCARFSSNSRRSKPSYSRPQASSLICSLAAEQRREQ